MKFDIMVGDENVRQRLSQIDAGIKETTKTVEDSGKTMEDTFKKVGAAAAGMFSVAMAKEFVSKVYEVRSYFQDIESSMKVFLGSEEKAVKFTKELKDYAWYNMFEFSELADASKQLIAYGNEVERISGKGGILDQLSNIATATKQPLMELVNMWNKAKNIGYVDSKAMITWASHGLVLNDVLKEMGETVKGNTITFEQLQMAIAHVTEEGGMFAGIMDEMMPNLSSSVGQLQDDLDSMFNEIGLAMQDTMKAGIEFVSKLVNNYKEIASVLGDVIVVYGTYKAALLATTAVEKASAYWTGILTEAEMMNKLATEAETIAKGKATAATIILQRAQQALNATLLSNPYALVAAALASLIVVAIRFQDTMRSTEEICDDFETSMNELKDLDEEANSINALADEFDELKGKIELSADESDRLLEVTRTLAGFMPTAIDGYDQYGNAIDLNTEKVREELQARIEAQRIVTETLKKEAEEKKKALEDELEERRRVYQDGKMTYPDVASSVPMVGVTSMFQEAGPEQKFAAAQRAEEISKKLDKLNNDLRNYDKILSGYYQHLSQVTGSLSGKNIDQLKQIKAALEEQIKSGKKGQMTVGDFFSYDFTGASDEFMQDVLDAVERKLPMEGTTKDDSKQLEKIRQEEHKLTEVIAQEERNRLKSAKESQSRLEDARIAAMTDGVQRALALRQKADQDELDEVEKSRQDEIRSYIESEKKIFDQREKLKKAQDDSYVVQFFDEDSVDLSKINAYWDKYLEFVKQRQQVEKQETAEDAMNEYLAKWGKTEEKRLATKKIYEKKIREAETEGERFSYQREMIEALAELDRKAMGSSALLVRLFEDTKKKSLKELRELSTKGAKLLEFLKKGKWDQTMGNVFGITKEVFDEIRQSPDELKDLSDALDDLDDRIEEVLPPIEQATQALKDLFAAGGDTNLATEAISNLSTATGKLNDATSVLSASFEAIGKLTNSDKLSDYANTLNGIANVISGAVSGAQAGAAVGGGYGAIIGAILGGGTSLITEIDKNVDNAENKRIEKLRNDIETLSRAYEELDRAISKSYSNKQSQLYEQEAQNLEQQRELVQKQLEEEQSKKHVDEGALSDYQKQLQDLDNKIEDTKEKAIDAIIGSDVSSAIESFADAYASAWENGENKATSARDTVVKLMKDTVREAIKAATESSGIMAEIRKKMAEYMFDNVLEDFEQKELLDMADTLQKQIDDEFGWADGLMSGRTAGITSGSSKSLSTMSEQTGSALEGRFTAFQSSNQDIADSMRSSLAIFTSMLTIATSSNGYLSDLVEQAVRSNIYLSDIAKYTKKMSGWDETLDEIASNTENL